VIIAALTDSGVQTAIVGAIGAIIVAVVTTVGVLLGKQNSRQHGDAAVERSLDRIDVHLYRQGLDGRIQSIKDDVRDVRVVITDHVHGHAHESDPDPGEKA